MNNIPTITKNLLIINILAYLATAILQIRGINLAETGGLYFFMTDHFHAYQLLTYMFLHGGFTHILFNMFALWMFGGVIERVWGPNKFLFYYISCGIGAGLVQEFAQWLDFYGVFGTPVMHLGATIGASGAIYAILLAFGMIFPNERILIFPIPIPIKAKWLVVGYVALELLSAISASNDGVAHTAHLGGMLFGFIMIRYWQRHPDSSTKYGKSHGRQFFENMRRNYERHKANGNSREDDVRHQTDAEYNARKRKNQEEIDAILDKIRKSGYDSLSKEEKKKLFDQSKES